MSEMNNKTRIENLEKSKSETVSSFVTYLIPSKQEYCI
jgi:hypothetical protein